MHLNPFHSILNIYITRLELGIRSSIFIKGNADILVRDRESSMCHCLKGDTLIIDRFPADEQTMFPKHWANSKQSVAQYAADDKS